MNYNELKNIQGKLYALNFEEFKVVLCETLHSSLSDGYLLEKWDKFQNNPLGFILQSEEYYQHFIKEIGE